MLYIRRLSLHILLTEAGVMHDAGYVYSIWIT